MSFLRIDNALLSDQFRNNERIQMTQAVAWVWSYINGFNTQGKPLVMNTKRMAEACLLSPYQLNKIISQFEDWGILVRKELEDNPLALRAHWVAPMGEMMVALSGDDVSTWASRNANLEALPELLPPTLQAQAFAKANREAPEAKPAKNGRKKIDGIWLRFDDHVVVGLWKEFLSNVTKARKGFVSVKSAQWLATELNKATTPQLAALYLSNAIDNCREVLSVPAEWQQKKSESVAFVIYDHVAQEMANKETEAREDKWQSIINDGREIFADSFWFPLLEQMQNPTEDNGRWTLDVMDAEHGCLYEALVDPEFQLKVLKPILVMLPTILVVYYMLLHP